MSLDENSGITKVIKTHPEGDSIPQLLEITFIYSIACSEVSLNRDSSLHPEPCKWLGLGK